MAPTQAQKTKGHAEHLLDAFIGLREKYALLHPMLFDDAVVAKRGNGQSAHGFVILKNTLFLACAVEIAKVALDVSDRAPSVKNLVCSLTDESLRAQLREEYSGWRIGDLNSHPEELRSLLAERERFEQAARRVKFDEYYADLARRWSTLSQSSALKAYRDIRDKLGAHTDIHYDGANYRMFDIGSLGLKWREMKETIDELQAIVQLLSGLVRNAGFAFDMLDEQLREASEGFWSSDDDR
jgi:hypothetical protein